ncbi:MAG: hypothetical protein ACRDDF_04480 [Aeromonas sp.]
MNEKDFNEQEYLKACLIRDMLNAKGMVATYVNVTEVMKKEKEKLQQEVEDWKCKCSKMDDEMCELKKENARLREELNDKKKTLSELGREKYKVIKKVECVDTGDFEYITIGKIYDVIEDDDEEHYRIITDDGSMIWFYKKRFKVVPF